MVLSPVGLSSVRHLAHTTWVARAGALALNPGGTAAHTRATAAGASIRPGARGALLAPDGFRLPLPLPLPLPLSPLIPPPCSFSAARSRSRLRYRLRVRFSASDPSPAFV